MEPGQDQGPADQAIHGDPRRMATSAIAGFVYQAVVASIAWLRLRPDEDLYLEVAEDYAVAACDALKGVQVKHTADAVTSNNPSVVAAIDSLFDLQLRNPERTVSIVYFSTSSIGLERAVDDRALGEATLLYWGKVVARQAAVQPLRDRLARMPLGPEALAFLRTADDERFRQGLADRIEWACGAPNLEEQHRQFDEMLMAYGEEKGVPPSKIEHVKNAVL